ncbi:formylglycine-generating enzyme family protein [Iningainema sp. BLCCT55]|uniref:Formylglycine-generating enzyme family protein n=2 Tax=Iningainema TaxID=1932705 RepID=A0A8J6Y1J7_9CYAN|nr:formylglycine-generating enzyme family protein [Iningainema tapete BLCC-T55]
MSQSIGDEAAIEFAVGFYAALGAGRTYEFAYEMGCNAILLAGIPENLTPILLKKSTLKEKLNLTTQAESTNKLDRPSTTSAFNRSGEELRNQIADKSIEVNSSLNNEVKFELNQQILDAQMQGLLTLIQQNNDVSSQAITAQLNFITSTFEFEVVTVDAQGKEINRCQKQAHCFTKDLSNGVILEMVAIPGGTFWMGSHEPEVRQYPNEGPQHLVSVKPFLISKYPITQAQWEAVAYLPIVYQKLEPCPSRFQEKNRPVEQVSWHDAVEFCARLSEKTGHEFRLPTEAEWEYACRARSKTPFHFGETITPDLANYDGEYIYRSGPKGINCKETTIVGSFQVANAFGLFDMHGLVWEWCLDHWHESYENAPTDGNAWLNSSDNQERVIRGGSWRNEPLLCRSAYRRLGNANQMLYNVGFRVVCTLQLNLESKS